jgi:excisionase family DNA binding protein
MANQDLYEQLDRIEALLQQKEKVLLSVTECSKILNVSVHFLYQKSSRRELPCYKIGRRLVFVKDEIIKWALDPKNRVKTITELEDELLREKNE